MESTVKTNRLAIISFTSGLIVLLSLGLYWVLFPMAYPLPTGYSPETINRTYLSILDLSVPIRNICASVALITGIFALREIRKKRLTEKGKTIAWVGLSLGAGWILLGLLIGMIFTLAETFH